VDMDTLKDQLSRKPAAPKLPESDTNGNFILLVLEYGYAHSQQGVCGLLLSCSVFRDGNTFKNH